MDGQEKSILEIYLLLNEYTAVSTDLLQTGVIYLIYAGLSSFMWKSRITWWIQYGEMSED